MTNGTFLSEEFKVEIVVKLCLPMLSYCAGIRRVSAEELQKCNVCFNVCFLEGFLTVVNMNLLDKFC